MTACLIVTTAAVIVGLVSIGIAIATIVQNIELTKKLDEYESDVERDHDGL